MHFYYDYHLVYRLKNNKLIITLIQIACRLFVTIIIIGHKCYTLKIKLIAIIWIFDLNIRFYLFTEECNGNYWKSFASSRDWKVYFNKVQRCKDYSRRSGNARSTCMFIMINTDVIIHWQTNELNISLHCAFTRFKLQVFHGYSLFVSIFLCQASLYALASQFDLTFKVCSSFGQSAQSS